MKGAAWSVPAIAAAVAVPAATASGALSVTLTNLGASSGSVFGPVRAYVRDVTGSVAGATVVYTFTSSDGGTVVVGGETQPGGVTPVTGRTDSAGNDDLTGIVGGKAGSVTVVVTASTADGRTATSNAVTLAVKAVEGRVFTRGAEMATVRLFRALMVLIRVFLLPGRTRIARFIRGRRSSLSVRGRPLPS